MVLPHSGMPRLSIAILHAMGTLSLDVNFSIVQPWTILFGPSGSGKTTVLRTIAGLIYPDSAKITAVYADHNGCERSATMIDTEAHYFVPSHRRSTPLAAQRASLFPLQNVRQQIVYGMTLTWGKEKLEERTEEIFTLFRIAHLADKLPAALSGGEAQRVHLARSAAAASGLLLLDEPFSGLEMTLRSEIMGDLQAWAASRSICVLSVTHDIAEAFQLDAEVIKLSAGRIVQQGPVATVLAEERARLLEQLSPSE
jgi:molybdate transport system ATP-binding protein